MAEIRIAPALADKIRDMDPEARARVRAAVSKVGRTDAATHVGAGINMNQADGYMVFTKAHRSSRDGTRTVFVLDVEPATESQALSA